MESSNQIGCKDCIFAYYLKKGICFSKFSSPKNQRCRSLLSYLLQYSDSLHCRSIILIMVCTNWCVMSFTSSYDNDMMIINTRKWWWFIFTPSMSNIVSLHKKAKQSFILSRPFLFSTFCYPLFISAEIAFVNSFPQSV